VRAAAARSADPGAAQRASRSEFSDTDAVERCSRIHRARRRSVVTACARARQTDARSRTSSAGKLQRRRAPAARRGRRAFGLERLDEEVGSSRPSSMPKGAPAH